MAERFERGDLVRVSREPRRLWRVTGFRRWSGYNMVSLVAEVGTARIGTARNSVPDYALEHAEDAVTRLGRLARRSSRRGC